MLMESSEKTTRRVAKNGIAQMVRIGVTLISKMLIVIVIARLKGVQEVGDFSFVMNYTLALGFLDDFGLTVLIMREIARDRDHFHEYTENSITLSIGMGFISIFMMTGLSYLLGYQRYIVTAVFLTSVALVLDTMGNLYVSAFSGYERMELGALAIVIQELAFLFIAAAVLYYDLNFLWIFVVFILSRFISLIASAQIYWKYWGKPPRLGFDWPLIKSMCRKTLPFAVTSALSPVYARIDTIILSYIKGNIELGYYEVASTLFYRLNVMARFYNLAIMPLIANQYPLIGKKVVEYVKQALKYQAMVGAPITILSLILGGPLILSVYGRDFGPTVLAFQIMSTAIFLRLVDNTLAVTLTALLMEGKRSLATAIFAAVNFILNIIAIPRYGFLGAAVTSVITEVGFFGLIYYYTRTRLPNPFTFGMIARPFLASFIMAIPLLLLHQYSVWLLLPLGIIIYTLLALPLGVITLKDISFILRVGKVENFVPKKFHRLLDLQQTQPEEEVL
jgi:O-antigen/teichoic acid export membrane protein